MDKTEALENPTTETKDLEIIIAHDPIVGYKLLKLITSSSPGGARKVESIHEGINIIGMDRIRRWATLLSLASQTETPLELSSTALARARMCQLAGVKLLGPELGNSCFTAGLFSTMDSFLNMPMDAILEGLPLSFELNEALLYHKGIMGKLVADVIAYEQGRWDPTTSRLPEGSEQLLSEAYTESLGWVTEALEEAIFG